MPDAGPATESSNERFDNVRRRWPALVCFGSYVLLTIFLFGPSNSIGYAVVTGPNIGDTADQIWFLAWVQHALAHGFNPFFSAWQNYPAGFNLLSDTSMVALGTLLSPITALFGPVVSWNLLVRLAVVVSAMSMCLVLRRWTSWWPAAFVGGLLYGFSPYIYYSVGHAFLVFVPLPPLMFLLLHEILVRQKWRPGRTGALLGAVCAVQYLISSEILVTSIIMGAIATIIYLTASRKVLAAKWPYLKTSLVFTLLAGGLLIGYPVLFTVLGPEHLDGPPQTQASLGILHADLLSPIRPGGMQWIAPQPVEAGLSAINGWLLYMGAPLTVALIAIVVWLRKRGIVIVAAIMTVVALLLSLGATLYVAGNNTGIPLPFDVLANLPILDGLYSERFSLFTYLFSAGIIAIGLEELHRRLLPSNHLGSTASFGRKAWASAVPLALAVIVALPLVPGHGEQTSPSGVSSFFTSALVQEVIPPDSVVLSYPYPRSPLNPFLSSDLVDEALLDQASSGMRYKLVGGYGWWRLKNRDVASPNPPELKPTSVESFFDSSFYGAGTAEQEQTNNLPADIRQFVRDHNVDTVLVLPIGKNPGAVVKQVTLAIGPPRRLDGVDVWSNVQHRIKSAA